MAQRAVITSIPVRIERTVQGNPEAGPAYQAHCIQSWRQAGFDVLSLNAADEAGQLRMQYPDLDVLVAPRDARARFGAPLVYVNDLVTALGSRGYAVAGIVNSDIFTMQDAGYFDRLCALCDGSAVYGMRLDVSDLAPGAKIEFYSFGYDYFFFDVPQGQAVIRGDYVLGMPWWDHWFPMALAWAGLKLKRNFSPAVFHLKHPERTGGILNFEWRDYFELTLAHVHAELKRSRDPDFKRICGPAAELGDPTAWDKEAVALGKMIQAYLETAAEPEHL